MTTMSNVKTAPLGAETAHGFAKRVLELTEGFRRWREARRTVSALRGLSARQLDDIGLTPADVDDFAARGRF